MRALHKLLIQFSHTHTQTVQIIQRPQIEYRERDRNRSMRHSIQTHTQNSQCRINGEESERYKMQPRGTRVSGGLPTLSFSRRSSLSLYRRPHTQSDPADGGPSMLVAFHAKTFRPETRSKEPRLWSRWRLECMEAIDIAAHYSKHMMHSSSENCSARLTHKHAKQFKDCTALNQFFLLFSHIISNLSCSIFILF
jgi:hypothetical protein